MNVIAQRMAEISGSPQLNAKANFNPGGNVYGNRFTFSSLINDIRAGNTPGLPEISRQKGYNGNGRIEKRPDRQTAIDRRKYNRGTDEIKGRPEQPDVNRGINSPGDRRKAERKDEFAEIDNNNNADPKPVTERDCGQSGTASGKKGVERNDSEMGEVSNSGSDESPLNEIKATNSGQGGGEDNADAILSDLLNILAEESTGDVSNADGKASGKPGSGEGAGNDPKTGAALNGIPAESMDSEINRANSENTEAAKRALTGLDNNNTKTGALLSGTGDADKKDSAGLEKLINAQAKPESADQDDFEAAFRNLSEESGKNTDLKKDHIRKTKSAEDAVKAELREGNSSVKELNSKAVSEFMGSLNREGGLKNPANNDAAPVRVEPGANNSGPPNNSGPVPEGGRISASLQTGNASRSPAFNEVADKIVYVAKGDNRLGVTIEHKELGKLNINLRLEKGMINVHINTADKAIREFVENNIQQIVDSLSKNGVSVGGFSVGLKNYKDSQGNADGNGKGSNLCIGGKGEKGYLKEANSISLNSSLNKGNNLVSILA